MAYTGSEAYDFSLFETQVIEPAVVRPAKAPKRTDSPKRTTPQRRKAKKRSSAAVQYASKKAEQFSLNDTRHIEEKVINAKYVKVACFGLICTILLAISLSLTASNYSVQKQIAAVNREIDVAQSEQVRLSAELSSLVATDRIENIAVNVLGMCKAEGQQIDYFTRNDGDVITVSGEKTLEDSSLLVGKIKELIAYIF